MQNETNFLTESEKETVKAECEDRDTITSADADSISNSQIQNSNGEVSPKENTADDKSTADFEELIKGPYKDAFTKKVQGIINKRFKEQKIAENKSAEQSNKKTEKITHTFDGSRPPADEKDKADSTYTSLIEAGIDPETAYRVLHLDEIMDSSMRYGAELAARELTDSLKRKSVRPFESALSQKGYSAKVTASSLTPQKRKELAKKALMGEQIGF